MKKNKKGISKITVVMCIAVIVIAIVIFMVLINGNNVTTVPVDKSNNTGNGTSIDESTINSKEASIGNPASIGEWTNIKLYGAIIDEKNNKIINNYNDAYIRINKMTRGVNELKPYIDKYNRSNINNTIDFNSLESTQEFALLEYEVYIPKDFKTDEDITNINIKIKTVSNEGKESIQVGDATYTSTYAVVTSDKIKPNTILPGNVIKCEAIIIVPQSMTSNDYLLAIEYTNDGNVYYKYIKEK